LRNAGKRRARAGQKASFFNGIKAFSLFKEQGDSRDMQGRPMIRGLLPI
jgi:hypothetical protein